MSRARRIEKYVEAVRHLRVLERAAADGEGLGLADDFQRAIKQAKIQVAEALRPMTGGDISTAQRMMRDD